MNFNDVMVLLLTLVCGVLVFQVLRELFGRKPPPPHYAPDADTSIRIDRRKMQRELLVGKVVLLLMCLLALIGGIVYFRGG